MTEEEEGEVSTETEPAPEPDKGGPEVLAISFFLALFMLTLWAFFYVLFDFVTDFLLAFLFAVLARPLYDKWLPKLWNNSMITSTIVCSIVVVIVLIPTSFLIASLSAEAVTAYDATRESVTLDRVEGFLFGDSSLAQAVQRAADAAGVEYTPSSVKNSIKGVAGAVAAFLGEQVNAVISNVFAVLFHFVMMILILFYLLIDGPKLKRYVFRLSPLPEHEEELITQQFAAVGRAILFGNGIGSLIQGIIGGVTMWAFGMPSAVLWGTVMTIFAFLPLAGIMVVVVPATAYLALNGRYLAAILFFAINLVQALFVENVVKTKLIGSHMKMHNLLIFLSIIGGLSVFGVIGILYGPLVVTMFLTLARLYESHYEQTIGERLSRIIAPRTIDLP